MFDLNNIDFQKLIQNPLFLMGMNILSRSGPQPIKQGIGSILGGAGIDTIQSLQQMKMLQRRYDLDQARLDELKAQTELEKTNAEKLKRQLNLQEKWYKKLGIIPNDDNVPETTEPYDTNLPNEPIPSYAKQSGAVVPKQVVNALIQVESGWNPKAVSRKGAMGLGQLMPDTIKRMKKVFGQDFNAFNPDDAVKAVEYELNRLYSKYKDWDKTLAAYNAGEEPVDRVGGIPNYPETIQYVSKIKNLLKTSTNQQVIEPIAQKPNLPLGLTPEQLVEAGVTGGMINIPGSMGLIEAAKFYEPKHIPANSYMRIPGTDKLTYLPNEIETKRLELETPDITGVSPSDLSKMKTRVYEQQAKVLEDAYTKLSIAPSQIMTLQHAKEIIGKSKPFVGSFADTKIAIAQFVNNNIPGVSIKPEEMENAQDLRSSLFRQIMDNLKSLDSTPTLEQQKAMQQALGSINTDPNALRKILDITENSIRSRVNEHNIRVEQGKNTLPMAYDLKVNIQQIPTKNATSVENDKKFNNGVLWLKSQVKDKNTARIAIELMRKKGWPEESIKAAFDKAGL